MSRKRKANLIAVETAIIEELRGRKAVPRDRHFLKFDFGHTDAEHLLLRNVLRDPEVYSKHPEPEVAAAMMVCDQFRPQVQALLCNYSKVAQELDTEAALKDELKECQCCHALSQPDQTAFNSKGHLVLTDTRKLRWPYLRTLVQRGKKFRLQGDMEQVFTDLHASLQGYSVWCSRGKPERLQKLEEWADAVYERCRANWARKLQSDPKHAQTPDGYPGLRRVIREAHESLVFLLDDRAPHGIVVVCKRWYQQEMAKYLTDNAVFEDTCLSWSDIHRTAAEFNEKWGFATGNGVVYNYGIWKPTKSKFRFIAGTRSQPPDIRKDSRRRPGPPRQPLYDAHKALVRVLQHVERVLKDKDVKRQADEGIKAFWGIDSIAAFTRMIRARPDAVLQHGQMTADFCTMYTSFPFASMIERTMISVAEAFQQQTESNPPPVAEGVAATTLTLGVSGWSWLGEGYTMAEVRELLTFLIHNNFTFNGNKVRRQIMGMPMGMPAAPQIANLACYPVEKAHAYTLGRGMSAAVCRYIDDIYSAGVPLPPQEAYGMSYAKTGEGDSVVYLGVKVYIAEHGGKRQVHTTVFDREESYPHHIVRYPEFGTVAPCQQLGGVVMGRLVNCQETCSHMQDFKESVGNVFRHALWRGYPRRLVQSVWSRFLFQRWHSTDIRTKELPVWFPRVWKYLLKTDCASSQDPVRP